MPFAVLKSVREVSSEDKLHCASSLLQNSAQKKWKTGVLGEKSAYVIIEMETAYSIKGIDIGNEYSAFVEVLVGGPGCTRENFKEILMTCSFMTPVESKNSSNSNRVRCFSRDALVEETVDGKWKLLKIVCTQPFNRHVKYGLSFIKIHVDGPPDSKKKVDSNGTSSLNASKQRSRAFTLREDSPDSESESKASLFNRWRLSRNKDAHGTPSFVPRTPSPATVKISMNTSIPSTTSVKKPTLNNGSSLEKNIHTNSGSAEKFSKKENNKVADRNRDSLLFTDDDNESNIPDIRKKRLEKAITADQERVTKENNEAKKPKKYVLVKNDDKNDDNEPKKNEGKVEDESVCKKVSSKTIPSSSASKPSTPVASGQRRPSSSPCLAEKPKKPRIEKPVEYRPFNQLLRGVVLVISGIQNPDRADLRTKALALGAKYKPDWDSSSTHLICAFKNTPKYTQVRGVGKIITRSWIEDCYSHKKRLPWRRYALDSAELSKPESDEEIFDESLKPEDKKSSNSRQSSEETDYRNKPSQMRTDSEDDDDVTELYDNNAPSHSQHISSGSDTEDEIQKVLASTSPKKKPAQTANIFELSTEEEDYVSIKANRIPKTLNFFNNLAFFISDQLSAVERIKVERCIETFNGALTNSLEKANYAIANKPISGGDEFKGETVTPLWILECNDSESRIPTKRYLVT